MCLNMVKQTQRKIITTHKQYVNDLKNNSKFALTNVNFTKVTKNIDKQNNAGVIEAYFNELADVA
jgi:hypothetical protein